MGAAAIAAPSELAGRYLFVSSATVAASAAAEPESAADLDAACAIAGLPAASEDAVARAACTRETQLCAIKRQAQALSVACLAEAALNAANERAAVGLRRATERAREMTEQGLATACVPADCCAEAEAARVEAGRAAAAEDRAAEAIASDWQNARWAAGVG